MNLLADEGIDRQIVAALREKGYSVGYIAEMAPGISDDVVLELANSEGVLLLTADEPSPQQSCGVSRRLRR